jgi:hypothetical protein
MRSTSQALTVAGIDVATGPSILENGSHSHGLYSEAGYVVRQTQRDGVWLWRQPADADGINRGPCGEDVAVFEGPFAFAKAGDAAVAISTSLGNHALVDRVYACGCRS